MVDFKEEYGYIPDDHEPDNFDPVPEGEYIVVATKCEQKKTKNIGGEYLKFEFQITEGDFKGRKLWQMFNMRNANPVAAEIGKKQLTQFCRACGKPNANDSNELLSVEVKVRVKIRPGKDGYDPSNDIKKFMPIGDESATASTTGTADNTPGQPNW